MQNRIPKPGEFYKHFKGKLYQIITVATHSETGESLVVYQALYGDYKTYVRPLAMFISKVDTNIYPNVTQTYRFELQQIHTDGTIESLEIETNQQKFEKILLDTNIDSNINQNIKPYIDVNTDSSLAYNMEQKESQNTADVQEVNPLLISFLDATTYEEKLQLLVSFKNKMSDRLLEDIATSLDIVLNDGSIEERYEALKMNLQTQQRFECNRLR